MDGELSFPCLRVVFLSRTFVICFKMSVVSASPLFSCGKTRPDTRHKMRLVCVLFTFENNTGYTDGPTDLRTDGRTDTTSYRDATAHLKRDEENVGKIEKWGKGTRAQGWGENSEKKE